MASSSLCRCKYRAHPCNVRSFSFGLLSIHFRSAAQIVVTADDVQRGEGDAANRPSQILAELVELRIVRLTFDWNGALAETASVRIKHGADLGEALQRIDLGLTD